MEEERGKLLYWWRSKSAPGTYAKTNCMPPPNYMGSYSLNVLIFMSFEDIAEHLFYHSKILFLAEVQFFISVFITNLK